MNLCQLITGTCNALMNRILLLSINTRVLSCINKKEKKDLKDVKD